MKIAILLSRFPYPLERGDKLRAFHQIKFLSQKHDIYLYATNDQVVNNEDLEKLLPYCKHIEVHALTWTQKLMGIVRALIKGWPLQTGIVYVPDFHQKIKHQIAQYDIDVIYCQLIRMVPYCNGIDRPRILDFMDAFGESMLRRSRIVSFPESLLYAFESKRVGQYECQATTQFDKSTIISYKDKNALQCKNTHGIEVVSNGIDTTMFSPNDTITQNYDIGFIGNMGYLPNIEAAEYLVNEVAMLYRQKYDKQLRVLLAGARPDPRVNRLKSDHVTVLGWVDKIHEVYQSFHIMVAPIFSGTGQQNKILEAMACGTSIICNEDVNDAIGATHEENIILTRNVDDMVSWIHLLLHNKEIRTKISASAHQFVNANYSWSKVTENLNQYIENAVLNYKK